MESHSRDDRTALLRPGQMFEGVGAHVRRCRVVRPLGRGGMGEVHEVVCERKRYALKVMDVAGYSEKEIKKRLLEGQIHRNVGHPNVVRVFDTGLTRDRVAWVLMELLYGCTMRDMLSSHSPLPLGQAVWYLLQILGGVGQLHEMGVVHLDVKPENVFLQSSHVVKVLDLGLARFVEGRPETGEGKRVGTPPYMAPEQFRSRPVTPATDVHAVGVSGFEMIWGGNPWVANVSLYDPHELTTRIMLEDPPSLEEVGVPSKLASVFAKALQKEPAARYKDAPSFERELRAAWNEAVEEQPELDTFRPDVSTPSSEPRFGRGVAFSSEEMRVGAGARTVDWFPAVGSPSTVVTAPLPQRRAVARALTVKLPDAQRDPSSVLAHARLSEEATARVLPERAESPVPASSGVRLYDASRGRGRVDTMPLLNVAVPLRARSANEVTEVAKTLPEAGLGEGLPANSPLGTALPEGLWAKGDGSDKDTAKEAREPQDAGRFRGLRRQATRAGVYAGLVAIGLLGGRLTVVSTSKEDGSHGRQELVVSPLSEASVEAPPLAPLPSAAVKTPAPAGSVSAAVKTSETSRPPPPVRRAPKETVLDDEGGKPSRPPPASAPPQTQSKRRRLLD